MPPIVASAEVDRPATEAFAYATDPARFPEWQAGVVSGRMDGRDFGVGARCVTVRRIGGTERASSSELGGGGKFRRVVLADGEDVQAELVGEIGLAQRLGGPVDRAVLPAGTRVALNVAQGQDGQFRGGLLLNC